MRMFKVLLLASLFGTGTAFASEDLTEQKPEQIPDQYALQEGDMIYIYPVEVTEYYVVVPSESSEAPG